MATTINEELAERVARGAALLDKMKPGWFNKVNDQTLKLTNCVKCILGQLYDYEFKNDRTSEYASETGYGEGMQRLGLNDYPTAEQHGFYSKNTEYYRLLHDIWIDVIANKRKEAELKA